MTTNEMAPADFAAIMNGNGGNGMGWGGMWGEWMVIFVILAMFGWGGFGGFGFGGMGGFGMNGMQGALTRGDLCMDMNFSDLEGAVRNIQQSLSDGFHGIDNAVCTLGYQNAQLINGVQMQVANEFRGLDNAICTLGFNTQQGMNGISRQISDASCLLQGAIKDGTTQGIMNTNAIQGAIKDCCCENEKIAMQTRFDMQQYNCGTIQAIDKMGDRIIDYLANEKAQALRDENQALRLAASQQAQNNYLIRELRPPVMPAYLTCNPYTASFGIGLNNFNPFGGCNGNCN